jgi:hypothetical protein
MRKFLIAVAAMLLVGATTLATPGTAEARWGYGWGHPGWGGGWHRGWGWRGGGWGWRGGWGYGALAAGALAGAALAAPYYGYPYGYPYASYPYYGSYPCYGVYPYYGYGTTGYGNGCGC